MIGIGRRLRSAGHLEQELDAPFGLVDPVLDQAGGCHVTVLVAKRMGLAHAGGQLRVVAAKLRQHVLRRDEVGIVVENALRRPI